MIDDKPSQKGGFFFYGFCPETGIYCLEGGLCFEKSVTVKLPYTFTFSFIVDIKIHFR
jgi:hypothetical protein